MADNKTEIIMQKRYLRSKDVAELLGMGKNTAYKFISQQGFPKIKIGKRYFIPRQELEKYLTKHIGTKIILD